MLAHHICSAVSLMGGENCESRSVFVHAVHHFKCVHAILGYKMRLGIISEQTLITNCREVMFWSFSMPAVAM